MKIVRRLSLLLALSSSSLYAQTAAPNHTAMWWNPAESGWGLNVAHQGDVLFPMWFTYGSDGKIQWLAVSGAAKQPDGSYSGEVFRFSGKPFNQISNGQAFNGSSKVGNATLRFTGSGALAFSYTVDGISQSKQLSRFAFGPEPSCSFTGGSRASATNYTDIWWNGSESGWGLTLAHQGETLFGLWYTYDAAGKPQWISATGTRQADGSFRGDLNRAAAGTAFNQISGSSATSFPLPKAGTFELRFADGESGSFKYQLDGIEQTKQITRFVFGGPVSVCSAAPVDTGGGQNADCFRPFTSGDLAAYRNTSTVSGAPFPIPPTITNYSQRTRDATFEGEAVKLVENLTASGRVEARHYYRNGAAQLEHIATESLNEAGAIAGTTRFAPVQVVFPRSLAVGQSVTYRTTATTTGTAAGTLVSQVDQTYKLVGRESVTVPAGTFANACRIETSETVSQSGVTSSSTATVWTLGTVGNIKTRFTGAAAGFAVDTTIELTAFGN